MWTSGRRKKLQEYARQYEAVIVIGCESATETVRDAVGSTDCKVIEYVRPDHFPKTFTEESDPGLDPFPVYA